MHQNRLIALVIIGLFALGFARLLIDTGIREESPDVPEADMDFYARAACTAIGDPLAEAFGVTWQRTGVRVRDDDAGVACRLEAEQPEQLSAEEVVVGVRRLFSMSGWDLVDAADPMHQVYARGPVACTAEVADGIAITCVREPAS